jgi:hypothetical protein
MGLKSLQLAEKSKNKENIRRFNGHLSEVYQNIGEPEIAIDYIKKELLLDNIIPGPNCMDSFIGYMFLRCRQI